MQDNIPTLYILELDSCVVKSAKISTIYAFLPKKFKKAIIVMVNMTRETWAIRHVETMFGNKGEGLPQACISSSFIFVTFISN